MGKILEGIRVIDFSRYIAGPYCTMMLADMGAEVIKIEKPGEGDISRTVGPWKDGASIFYATFNRNKKSLAIDTRSEDGRKVLRELIEKSDVIVENFRVGTMAKMGLTWEEVQKINPRMIMASITGFGQDGPMRDRLAYDGIISAMSGVTRISGDHIERSKGALHDTMAALNSMYGIMLALYDREKTGKGQFLDIAMLACSTMLRSDAISDTYLRGEAAAMVAEDSGPYGYVHAKDGFVNIYANTDAFFAAFKTVCDDPLLHEERFAHDMALRTAHNAELMAVINKWAGERTCDEVEEICSRIGIPVGIVATPGRLLNSEQLNYRGHIVDVPMHGVSEGKSKYMGFPIKMSAHPDIEYKAAPLVGEHNDEILRGVLGKTDEDMAALKNKGII